MQYVEYMDFLGVEIVQSEIFGKQTIPKLILKLDALSTQGPTILATDIKNNQLPLYRLGSDSNAIIAATIPRRTVPFVPLHYLHRITSEEVRLIQRAHDIASSAGLKV